tara:strand:- start:781 stop:984 length:204 start_codon:yes stop_codon:yes gene_type:complete
MRLDISFEIDNAAFVTEPGFRQGTEASFVLIKVAQELNKLSVLETGSEGIIRDFNGNTVGVWKIKDE